MSGIQISLPCCTHWTEPDTIILLGEPHAMYTFKIQNSNCNAPTMQKFILFKFPHGVLNFEIEEYGNCTENASDLKNKSKTFIHIEWQQNSQQSNWKVMWFNGHWFVMELNSSTNWTNVTTRCVNYFDAIAWPSSIEHIVIRIQLDGVRPHVETSIGIQMKPHWSQL